VYVRLRVQLKLT